MGCDIERAINACLTVAGRKRAVCAFSWLTGLGWLQSFAMSLLFGGSRPKVDIAPLDPSA